MSPYYSELRSRLGSALLLVPSVAALVRNAEGDLLLQKKGDGSWSLPAGAIEPGESPEEALAREVCEETGHQIINATLVGVYSGADFRYTYANGDQVEYMVALYECTSKRIPHATLAMETVALQYFSEADFPGIALPYPPSLLFARNHSL